MPPAKRSNDGKDPRAGGRYVWHKLRNTGVDYTMILRERRQWLLNQDLAKSETLLCEWFALVQELDAVTREELGVDKFGTKVVTQAEESERRSRSRSFNVKTRTSDADPYGIDGANRPRSNSFLEFLFGQEDLQNGGKPGDGGGGGGGAATPGGFAGSQSRAPDGVGPGTLSSDDGAAPGTPGSASSSQGAAAALDPTGYSATPKKVAFMKKKKGERAKSHSSNGGGDDNAGFVAIPPSPSPSAGGNGNGAPLVVSIKKKKKSKTPNKALKKMFKVVEKKASGKGFQSDGGDGGGGGGGGGGGIGDPAAAGGGASASAPSTPGTPASTPTSAGTDEEGAGRIKSWL